MTENGPIASSYSTASPPHQTLEYHYNQKPCLTMFAKASDKLTQDSLCVKSNTLYLPNQLKMSQAEVTN